MSNCNEFLPPLAMDLSGPVTMKSAANRDMFCDM